jgi:hypothetical protein
MNKKPQKLKVEIPKEIPTTSKKKTRIPQSRTKEIGGG